MHEKWDAAKFNQNIKSDTQRETYLLDWNYVVHNESITHQQRVEPLQNTMTWACALLVRKQVVNIPPTVDSNKWLNDS